VGGALLAAAVLGAPAEAAGSRKPAKLTVAAVNGVPVSVAPGQSFQLSGKVANAKRRKASAGTVRFALRTLQDQRVSALGSASVAKLKGGKRRAFAATLTVPAATADGAYLVRACVIKRSGGGRERCRLAIGVLSVAKPVGPPPAPPAPPAPPVDSRSASQKLRDAITVPAMMQHLSELQSIATFHGGNRASGLPGYDASASYVIDTLKAAGYRPKTQVFPFVLFTQNGPAVLARTDAGEEKVYVEDDGVAQDGEFSVASYSGSGVLADALLEPVDLDLGLGNATTSGCDAADFAGFSAGSVALIQRGGCTFGAKAANAEAAGAAGVVLFNQGNTAAEDRQGPFGATLGAPVGIPVVTLSYPEGEELATGTPTVDLEVDTTNDARTSSNVIADTPGGDPNSVVAVGAHLDSVEEGPGINDNGSGTAFVLELAVQMATQGIKPVKKVRFAFWGAEEANLIGSTYYVNTLPDAEFAKLSSNLNFDMLASPNHAKFVHDGDFSDSTAPASAPDVNPGAAEIEQLFVEYFDGKGLATEPTAFDGRSDYKAFQDNGIPAGGLFSGAEGIMTAQQAEKWGGTAGMGYDPNYHGAGDTIDNLDPVGFEQLADGGAHVLATLAGRMDNAGGGMAAAPTTRRPPHWGKRSERIGGTLQR
jgi:Zn-dependent M28 family amino/carboxypeptidase